MGHMHGVVAAVLPHMQRVASLRGVVVAKQLATTAFSRYLLLTNVTVSMSLSGQ